MRITSIELHSANSNYQCVFSFRDPRSLNPYQIKSISGLDADEITPRFYGQGGLFDQTNKYFELSLKQRVIVIKTGLNPSFKDSESYSDLRDTLYKLISASRSGEISLRFIDDDETVACVSGFITKFETDHFSESPETTITIECDDPMLRATESTNINVDGLTPMLFHVIDNVSTAPHGLAISMRFMSDFPFFYMADQYYTWMFIIQNDAFTGFKINDILSISSEHNNKYAKLTRDGVEFNLADLISRGSVWPLVFPGENAFISSGGITWQSISHRPAYWGV